MALQGSATPRILRRTLKFAAFAILVCLLKLFYKHELGLEVGPFEFAGAALGLLLVLRTNAGYERWWEARKLWGGIVNQCRNHGDRRLGVRPRRSRMAGGRRPLDGSFPHAAAVCVTSGVCPRPSPCSARGRFAGSPREHMPNFVAMRIADLIRHARDRLGMDQFSLLQIDRERSQLIDRIGACRASSRPLPRAYTIHIRRFIFLYLTTLPFAMIDRVGLLTPLFTILVRTPSFRSTRSAWSSKTRSRPTISATSRSTTCA